MRRNGAGEGNEVNGLVRERQKESRRFYRKRYMEWFGLPLFAV